MADGLMCTRSVRAVSDCEVVVLGRGHVQGVLAKDPAVRTEVQSVQERRRRERESTLSAGAGRAGAGPMVVFCGLDRVLVDASRGLETWWVGLFTWLPWSGK
jgi:CRP-like cAMP-binding protein